MKIISFRLLSNALGIALLSALFFTTSCQEKIDNIKEIIEKAQNPEEMLLKYETLGFSAEATAATTTSGAGSGTFTGNGDNITYYPPGESFPPFQPDNSKNNYKAMTDPLSLDKRFIVRSDMKFNPGGGVISTEGSDSIALGGTTYRLAYSQSLLTDSLGYTNSSNKNLNTFIGVVGDFGDIDALKAKNEIVNIGNPIELIIYAFTYNGVSEIKDVVESQIFKDNGSSFVVIVQYSKNSYGEKDATYYVSTAGEVDFINDKSVVLEDVKMRRFNIDSQSLTGATITLSGILSAQ